MNSRTTGSAVRFQQGHAHLAQGILDVVLGKAALATQILDGEQQAFAEIFEHAGNLIQNRKRGEDYRRIARLGAASFKPPPFHAIMVADIDFTESQ